MDISSDEETDNTPIARLITLESPSLAVNIPILSTPKASPSSEKTLSET
jgi:hypothetical protein